MKILSCGPDADLLMTNSGADRKAGLHLSDITKRMIFERDKTLNPDTPIDSMVLERGFTWETILERSLSARHERPGFRPEQMQEDGIWLSPDWVNPDQRGVQHEEWKATKKTTKHTFESKHWHWLPAAQAYLRALLKRGLARDLVTRFRVWHINGDYSYDSKTSDWLLLNDYWTIDVQFDKRELEDNWRGILQAGRKYGLLPEAPREEHMPKALERKLQQQYGKDSAVPYKVMNKMGVMHGNKITPKGRAVEKRHSAVRKGR